MEIESGAILHAETVDKREVDLQSPNMERKKAFIRSMQFLLSNIKCTEIITDASSSIQKQLGKNHYSKCLFLFACTETQYPRIFHSLDV